jgi:hypothetical protein
MGDVIQFVSKANANRESLIKEAGVKYESVFPANPHEAAIYESSLGNIAPEQNPA